MIRSSHFFLLLFMTCLILMSVQVWGQVINNQADTDPAAYMKPADVLTNNDHQTSTTTMTGTAGEFADEDTDQDNDDDDGTDDEEDDDMDEQVGTTYDIDEEPLNGGGGSGYYGLLHQGNIKDQEQGDDLGEELFVEYDDEEDDDDEHDTADGSPATNDHENNDGLLFEDDETPLDFKNNEEVDLDQLLFEASQKDTITTGWDYQQQQQQQEHDPLDKSATHDDIDQLLANADDALYVDPQDEAMDADGHPDHVTDTLVDSIFQEQHQQNNENSYHHHADQDDDALFLPPLPPGVFAEHDTPDDQLGYSSSGYSNHRSQYKLPLLGILVLLILLYKVSNKSQGGIGTKFLEKEENGLPLHNKDLNTQESMSYPSTGSILVTSPNTATQQNQQQHQQPNSTGGGHGYLGRRSSSTLSMSSGRKSSLSGVAASAVGVHGGHTRRISLGHPMLPHTIKESKWEGDWDAKADKRRQ